MEIGNGADLYFNKEENSTWIGTCWDDGTGRNVYYTDKSGKRSRIEPENFVPEYLANGKRRFYFRGLCIRCKDPSPAVFLTANNGEVGFATNFCKPCLLTTTIGITQVKGNGDKIYESNIDTPFHAYIDLKDLALVPDRSARHLQRSKDASLGVKILMKDLRNRDRFDLVKEKATEFNIEEGTFVSWGYGMEFDEYYGAVDTSQRPHGYGVKYYSDGSVYAGDWDHGQRHCLGTAFWSRPDGTRYEGPWLKDYKHGRGEMTYPDGTVYRGDFAQGFEHGQGVKIYQNQSRHEGRFRFGKRDGPGTFFSPEGVPIERRVYKENDAVFERVLPIISEIELEDEDGGSRFFQPDTLMNISIAAVAKAVIKKRQTIPSIRIQRGLQDFLKSMVAREFLTQITPQGSPLFIDQAPEFAFAFVPSIQMSHVKFKHMDAESFLYVTSSNAQLRHLALENNRLDPTSVDMLAKQLAGAVWAKLETLNLSFNKIDSSVLRTLVNSLQGTPCLKTLRLSGSGITPGGSQLIARFLHSSVSLRELDLSFNFVGAAGAEDFAEALEVNSTLTSLNLRQNNIGLLGGEALAKALKKNSTLRVLCIADNKIGQDNANEIAARLKGTTKEVSDLSFKSSQLRIPTMHLVKVGLH